MADFTYTLTIGMIVKNEEKHLKNCLEALKPLMEQVNSELIITDTGSTDGTVEIAKQYTDKVLHFEWCNDFAAARNYGLDRAQGKWFLYLDADEYLDDPEPLVRFLNTLKNEKYKLASLKIKNYEDEKNNFLMQEADRLFRTGTNRFFTPIHETPRHVEPKIVLDAVLHHYGYQYKTPEQRTAKIHRNRQLMDRYLNDHAYDLRMWCCYWDILEDDERPQYVDKLIAMAHRQKNVSYIIRIYHRIIRGILNNPDFYEEGLKKAQGLLDTIISAIENSRILQYSLIEFYALRFGCLWSMDNDKSTLAAAEQYFNTYRKIQSGALTRSKGDLPETSFDTVYQYNAVVCNYATTLLKVGQADQGLTHLLAIGPQNDDCPSDAYAKYISKALQIISQGGLRHRLPEVTVWLQAFPFQQVFTSAAYYAVKENLDLCVLLRGRTLEQNAATFAELSANIKDAPEVVSAYDLAPMLAHGLYGNALAKALYEAALSAPRDWEGQNELLLTLAHGYMQLLALYVNTVYAPEAFTEAELPAFPENHRLGYWFARALEADAGDDLLGYIRALRGALAVCPSSAKVIQALLREAADSLK